MLNSLRRKRWQCHSRSRSHQNGSTPASERFGRQILAVQRDDGTVTAFWIVDFLDVELEVDGADDAVAELLVNQRLQRRTVDLHHLVEAVDGRIGQHAARNAAA